MGCCCIRKQQLNQDLTNDPQIRYLLKRKQFKGMNFHFSREKLSKIEAQCLVVVCDKSYNLKNTNLPYKLTKKQFRKVEQEVQAYLDNKSLLKSQKQEPRESDEMKKSLLGKSVLSESDKNFILIDIDLLSLKYRKLLVIIMQPWQRKQSMRRKIQQRFHKGLKAAVNKGVKSLAILYIDDKLGITSQAAATALSHVLYSLSDNIRSINFCCKDATQQQIYFSTIQSFNQQNKQSFTDQSNKSFTDPLVSNYIK